MIILTRISKGILISFFVFYNNKSNWLIIYIKNLNSYYNNILLYYEN